MTLPDPAELRYLVGTFPGVLPDAPSAPGP